MHIVIHEKLKFNFWENVGFEVFLYEKLESKCYLVRKSVRGTCDRLPSASGVKKTLKIHALLETVL